MTSMLAEKRLWHCGTIQRLLRSAVSEASELPADNERLKQRLKAALSEAEQSLRHCQFLVTAYREAENRAKETQGLSTTRRITLP